jgi:transcriptional regulator with PAS, ATPase and Fis domain
VVETSSIAWDRVVELDLVRHLSQVARRRGLNMGWIDAAGSAALPHISDSGAPCPFGEGCDSLVRAALPTRASWGLVSPHAEMREIAAPVVVDDAVVGALLVGGYSFGDACRLPRLSDGEVGLFGELLVEAAREIAIYARVHTNIVGTRQGYDDIIGRSPPMQALYTTLDRISRSEATILIQGENGTGKELVARAIHNGSDRAQRAFVVTNCSAFNDNLLDSELFGYKRGAFTGAVVDKPGLFEVADAGTFFLDEISDMSPALQVKVLRVLQEGTFNRVGDTETRKVDVRIIAATNRDLRAMVTHGQFREDLYYRIHVINLMLPALRERTDDIVMLIDHFLDRLRRGGRAKALSPECVARLTSYSWPGNVRELENEVERLVVLSGDEWTIGEEMLSPRIRQSVTLTEPSPAMDDVRSLPSALEGLERRMIGEALRRHHGNKTRASAELKVSRRNLIRLVQKYGLDDARD